MRNAPGRLLSVARRGAAQALRLIQPDVLRAPLALTRDHTPDAASATVLGSDGATWAFAAENVARFSGAARRLLDEGPRTNLVRNPRFEGSITPGIVGSGAVLPTNFAAVPAANQTLELIGLTTVNGVPCLEFVWSASALSGTGTITIDATMAATGSATYAASMLAQLVAGSLANVSNFGFRVRTSLATVSAGTIQSMAGITSSLTRFSGTQAVAADATNIQLQVTFATTGVASLRFRIAAPQVELGSFASSPIFPPVASPGTSTRGADLVSAGLSSLGVDANARGAVTITAVLPQAAPAATAQTLLQIDDGSDNNAIVLRNAAGGNAVQVLAIVSGVAGTPVAVGTMTPGAAFTVRMEVDGTGGVAASWNGGAAVQLWDAPSAGLTTLRVGSTAAGGANMFGEVDTLIVEPSRFRSRVLAAPSAFPTPADAEYATSWWLFDATGLGDLQRVWGRYNGSTLNGMWLDSGIAYRADPSGAAADPDCTPNYDTLRHLVLDGVVFDGARIASASIDSDGHGTSTSKIAGAAVGGGPSVGVAPRLRLTCVHAYNPATRIFLTGPDNAAQEAAVRHFAGFEVGYTKLRINSAIEPWRVGVRHAAAAGRGGLGTVIASPAANATTRLAGNLRELQTIAALTSAGLPDATCNWSSAMLAACPHPAGSFTSGASAGMVGVNAMVVEANPALGWRDVKEIVSLTALHTGSTLGTGPTAPEVGLWQINAATGWCGGGRHWHQHYGFGKVDAQGAVGMAEAWRHLGLAARTSGNEVVSEQVSTGSITFNDANPVRSRAFTFADSLQVETIVVAMNTGGAARLLQDLTLASPGGTTIALGRLNVGEDADGFMRFAVEGFRGELAAGVWTLTTTDSNPGDGLTGTWAEGRVTIYGHTPAANRVHVVTDDMQKMVTFQAGRATLTAVGTDTLLGSALSGNATINLATGACTIAGQAVTLSGTFVAAHGGWGNDTIIGSNAGCLLGGGYGNDSIVGGTGADTIIGGPGADTLTGGAGNDLFRYTSVWDSPDAGRDVITDFGVATDKIDFAFGPGGSFIGAAEFSGAPRQVRVSRDGANTVVRFDLDGDGFADVVVVLLGALTLTADNFVFSAVP